MDVSASVNHYLGDHSKQRLQTNTNNTIMVIEPCHLIRKFLSMSRTFLHLQWSIICLAIYIT